MLRTLSSFLVALLVLGSGVLRADDPPTGSTTAEILSLSPGASLEREVQGGERLVFEFSLSTGTFLYLEVIQRRVSLKPSLLSPGGEVLIQGADTVPQLLALIADREGTYRLELETPQGQRASSRFMLKVRELRPAAAGDEDRVRGAKALAEALRLWRLGEDSEEAREREEARSRAEISITESLTAWRAAGDVRSELEALLNRAAAQSGRGEIKTALPVLEDIVARARAGGFAEIEARALSTLGGAQGRLGNHEQAVQLLNAALEIWNRIGSAYEQASVLQMLGLAYQRKQDYEAELKTFSEALRLSEISGDAAQRARALSGLGASHYYLGHPSEAREIWEKALALCQEAGETKTRLLVENNLAVLYQNQGQFQKALNLYRHLIEGVALKNSGLLRMNIGNLYADLGNPQEALESYKLELEGYRAAGDLGGQVDALVNIGRSLQELGDPKAALAEYEKAQKLLPEVSWTVLYSIALAKIELGAPAEALPVLQKALETAVAKKDRTSESVTLISLGWAFAKLGNASHAATNLQNGIEIGEEIGYQSAVSLGLLRRALLWRDQGRLGEALADVRKALAGVESVRRNIAVDQYRVGFLASKRTYYDLEIELLMKLDQTEPGKYRAEALAASEKAHGRGLLDLLAEGRIDVKEALAPDLQRREEDLAYRVSAAQIELRAGTANPERVRKLQEDLRDLSRQREQLDADIRSRNRRYAGIRYPVPLDLAQIQSLLPDDETALLEYALGETRSTLFVVTRKEISTYELPAAAVIAERVKRLRTALERESLLSRREYLDMGYQLYRDLLQPAAGALAGKSNLLIVPDRALYYVPFEALLTEPAGEGFYKDLPYLLRQHSIAYVPSASVLASLREPRQEPVPAERKQVAAFAPFATAESGTAIAGGIRKAASGPGLSPWSFEPLPASRLEISKITDLYPGESLSFIGSAANEDAVMRNPAVLGARRLHFATHAEIDEQFPERSALVLAERAGEAGFLDVPEIFNLKLSADLAVLSACQTGLGKEVTGEGLMGLSRAFFYAGVPSLVVSLWNVVDGPTPDLMLDFYRGLDELGNKARALQAAKLAMISRGKYAHPSYWAPFILLGEPQ